MRRHESTLDEIDAVAAEWVARRDAGLEAHEQAEFERWCAASVLHAEALARFEETWSVIGRPRRTGGQTELHRELNALTRHRRRRLIAATAAAAVLLAGGLVWRSERFASNSLSAPVSHTVVLTPTRQTLPDGTVVEYPRGAEIEVNYAGPLRRVTLRRGEAHFAVAKDQSRPFVVEAGGVEVRAVGTAFSVQLGSSQIEVLVTEGRVAVEKSVPDQSVPRPEPLAYVDAGKELVVELALQPVAASPVQAVAAPKIAERLAWRSTRVEFSGAPLAEVIAVLNRHNAVRFEFGSAALAEVPLSGLFRADDTEAFIHSLEAGFGIKAERRDGTIILRRAP